MEEKIKELILKELGLDVNQESRKREIIEARSLYFYLLKKLYPKMSLASIGESMNKNHATVIHSLKNYPVYEQYNSKLYDLKNLALHLFGEAPEEETELIKFKKKIFELEQEKNKPKPRYEIIENLYNLLEDTEGTEQHKLITLRLEAFYSMNKNIRL
jgi:hypothetical protein